MTQDTKAVFAVFSSRAQAESAVDALVAGGFASQAISALLSSNDATRELGVQKNTKTPEGLAAGATAGGVVGGTLGLLAGLGTLAIPGVGPFIAAGPIMGALAGLGVGAATGGLLGVLVGMGIPEYEAKRYENRVKTGGILVSVRCTDSAEVKKAKTHLKQCGGEDVAATGEASAG